MRLIERAPRNLGPPATVGDPRRAAGRPVANALLKLLEQHGYRFRIDIAEARQLG